MREWLERGYHGSMWLDGGAGGRARFAGKLWSEVRSIVIMGMNYGPGMIRSPFSVAGIAAPSASMPATATTTIVVMGALKRVAQEAARLSGAPVKVFVDTAPVMERALAEASGLGWQANTPFSSAAISEAGYFLARSISRRTYPQTPRPAIIAAPADAARYLPDDAFPQPYLLDARRCISYLHHRAIGADRPGIATRSWATHLWLR